MKTRSLVRAAHLRITCHNSTKHFLAQISSWHTHAYPRKKFAHWDAHVPIKRFTYACTKCDARNGSMQFTPHVWCSSTDGMRGSFLDVPFSLPCNRFMCLASAHHFFRRSTFGTRDLLLMLHISSGHRIPPRTLQRMMACHLWMSSLHYLYCAWSHMTCVWFCSSCAWFHMPCVWCKNLCVWFCSSLEPCNKMFVWSHYFVCENRIVLHGLHLE